MVGGIPKKYSGAYTLKKLEACFRGKEIMKNVLQAFYFEDDQQY